MGTSIFFPKFLIFICGQHLNCRGGSRASHRSMQSTPTQESLFWKRGTSPSLRSSTKFQSLACAFTLLVSMASSGVLAKDPDFIMDTSGIGKSENGYIHSDQLLELGTPTANALRMEGENSMRTSDLNRAITLLQRSVEMAPLDMDGRMLYAEALQKKLLMEKDKKNPILYNFIIKQWFFVYKKAEFLDQKVQGLSHVMDLTGARPKRFESDQKFLRRVLMPEDGSVKVALGGKRAEDESKDKEKNDDDEK